MPKDIRQDSEDRLVFAEGLCVLRKVGRFFAEDLCVLQKVLGNRAKDLLV